MRFIGDIETMRQRSGVYDDDQDGGGVAWLALVLGLCLLAAVAAGIVLGVMAVCDLVKGL